MVFRTHISQLMKDSPKQFLTIRDRVLFLSIFNTLGLGLKEVKYNTLRVSRHGCLNILSLVKDNTCIGKFIHEQYITSVVE